MLNRSKPKGLKLNFTRTVALLTFCSLILLLTVSQQLRAQETTFESVKAMLEQAAQVRAEVFSKNNYNAGLKAYIQADIDRQSNKSAKSIDKNLEQASKNLQEAIDAAQLFQNTFPDLVAAYDGAETANADTLAPKTYEEGMGYFASVVSKVEKADLAAAHKLAETAQINLRKAELEAIKQAVLGGAWDLLTQAQKFECPKETPVLFAAAQNALAEVERYIEADRYDRSSAIRLAEEATYAIQHAIYVTEQIIKLKEDENGWENEILSFEDQIKSVSSILLLNPRFDRELQLSTQAINAAIKSLQEDRRRLQNDLAKRDERIGELEADINKLKGQSDKYLAELEVKRAQIQKQKELDEIILRITSLFAANEGSVVRTTLEGSEVIIIRLTGLIFPSGSAKIRKEDFALLEKAKQAVTEFPDWKPEVQGHTDSQGDEAKNLKLSQDRADAVKEYLIKGLNLSADAIKAIGYGKSKPIASNDTAVGRNQNRRIEIILKDKRGN